VAVAGSPAASAGPAAPLLVRLYDSYGQLRLEQAGDTRTGMHLATATLPAGLYVVHILQNGTVIDRQQLQIRR